jgi:dTDP-4-dehydrorhamnose reductase
VFNYTNEGVASWYDFAYEVVAIAQQFGYPVKAGHVLPIPSSEYKTLATRPAYSVLSKRKIRDVIDFEIPHWKESLRNMLTNLQSKQ